MSSLASSHVWLHRLVHCGLHTALRRGPHDRVTIPIDAAARACVGLARGPGVRAWRHVLSIHQHRRRTKIDRVRRALRILAIPLSPDGGNVGVAADLTEDITSEIDIRAPGIVHEFDMELQAQECISGGSGQGVAVATYPLHPTPGHSFASMRLSLHPLRTRPAIRPDLAVLVCLLLLPLGSTTLEAQATSSTQGAEVQSTPEQRYGDWVRRLPFRAQEYSFRRSNMIRLLDESGGGIYIAPSSDGLTHGDTFRQLEDFWYYTGLEVPNSILVLDADAGRSILFMPEDDYRFSNPGRANDFPGRPLLDDYQLRSIAGIEEYRPMREFDAFLAQMVRARRIVRVNGGTAGALVTPELPQFGALSAMQTMILRIQADHPTAHLQNAFEEIAQGRMVKSRYEIQKMQIAADATAQAILATAALIRPGIDERTLQGEFESTCRALGSQTIPFTPIVKSGPNSLWPWRVLAAHYDRRNRPVESGDLVILDVGCEIDGYISDVGRTFPVDGLFTTEQRHKMLVSLNAADAIIEAIRPGVTFRQLTAIAYEAIPDDEERYMQTPSFFGHHIGMQAGDPALIDEPLQPGMVFTVEPWYYNHELDISVFVEDVVLVTEEGVEVLTKDLPRMPEQLEAVMQGNR